MKKQPYTNVGIYDDILEIVDILIKDQRVMIRSRSEFVHDALRKQVIAVLALYPDLKDKVPTEKIKE